MRRQHHDTLRPRFRSLLVVATRPAGELSDEQWSTQSLCPDWDVAGVVMHLISEEMLLDRQPLELSGFL